jgi:hypothetical protein
MGRRGNDIARQFDFLFEQVAAGLELWTAPAPSPGARDLLMQSEHSSEAIKVPRIK